MEAREQLQSKSYFYRSPGRVSQGTLSLLFVACLGIDSVRAVPEADPYPGPSKFAAAESIKAPRDIATPENTIHHPPPLKTREPALPAQNQPTGALSGRIIYTSGGHGYHASGSSWVTDRPTYQTTSEDLGNQDQMTQFVYQAFNAGATIVPMRPVGNQVNEVVIDNDDPRVEYFGTWSSSSGTPYYGKATDPVNYRFAAASNTESAIARYTPDIPVRGYYPVYGWVLNSSNRCIDQLYRIKHSGGVSEVRVNHRRVGKGWVYLGTYYFEQGTGGYCEISNQSSTPAGSNAIADAIRFGNGMGDIPRGSASVSGKPREEEASRYWVQAMMGTGAGSDSTVYDPPGNDGDDNVGAPLRMAAFMNDENQGTMTDRVYLSFHSNGGSGSARGALGLWNNEANPKTAAGTKTPNQLQLATYQGKEVNLDLSAIGSPPLEYPWSARTSHDYYGRDYAFGEIRWDTVHHEMDATINEVAFHDNAEDSVLLGNSNVRVWIARAATQGLVRYFNQFGGGPLAFAPEPPVKVKATANTNGSVTVSWAAPAATSIGGQPPTGYRVYTSQNGYGFGSPVAISGIGNTQTVLTGITPGQPVYIRVASVNAGGESLPSEVVAASATMGNANHILVVNGFDRQQRSISPAETNTGLTLFYRAKPWKSNNYDYVVQHAMALAATNHTFDSCANEAVTLPLLNQYDTVIWCLGQESTSDSTFSASEQSLVTSYLSGGKNLFVTGSEIAWDLDFSNNGRNFFRNTLGCQYVEDAAGTSNVSGGSGVFGSIGALTFGTAAAKNNTQYPPANLSPYPVDFPDVISPANANASAVLKYSNGKSAGVRYVNGSAKVITLGFPFETITSDLKRAQLMGLVMDDLLPANSGVQDWSVY